MKRLLIFLGILLAASNIPPIKPFIEIFISGSSYYYTTFDHSFNDEEIAFKGRNYEEVLRIFDNYKTICGECDVVLYRTFIKVPWKFWLWGEYLFHPKYRLAYIEMPKNYRYNMLNYKCKGFLKSI